jgi:hypothetical protein
MAEAEASQRAKKVDLFLASLEILTCDMPSHDIFYEDNEVLSYLQSGLLYRHLHGKCAAGESNDDYQHHRRCSGAGVVRSNHHLQ